MYNKPAITSQMNLEGSLFDLVQGKGKGKGKGGGRPRGSGRR